MPIEDLRKLYSSASNIAHVPGSKSEDNESSDDESTDEEEDSGFQRLLIVEHPTMRKYFHSSNDRLSFLVQMKMAMVISMILLIHFTGKK